MNNSTHMIVRPGKYLHDDNFQGFTALHSFFLHFFQIGDNIQNGSKYSCAWPISCCPKKWQIKIKLQVWAIWPYVAKWLFGIDWGQYGCFRISKVKKLIRHSCKSIIFFVNRQNLNAKVIELQNWLLVCYFIWN